MITSRTEVIATRTQRFKRTQRSRLGRLALVLAFGTVLAVSGSYVSSASFGSFASSTAVIAPSSAPAASSGTIRGRVDVRRPFPLTDRRPNVSDVGAPGRRDVPERARSVVYLAAAPRGAFEQSDGGRAVMNQRNETFVPHVLAITTGTTVDFPNSDRIYHNVFSLSKPGPFDLGRYAAGRSKAVRFDRPGIVRVFCDIHSHMSAFILVFSHPFYTMTDADGRYRLDNVPPGAYAVVAWNEGVSSDPSPVAVPDGGVAELDLVLR